MIVPSKFKLEEFNSCYPKSILRNMPVGINIVDVVGNSKNKYCTNEHDTLVFEAPSENTLEWMEFVANSRCDEFEVETEDGKKIIRMWWD